MGGSKKQTQTQTYQPPSWVEDASQEAIGIGRRIGTQQYTPYEGQRVAGLSENEQMGVEMARDTAGAALPYYDEAAGLARRSTESWLDADQQAYMNPYIKGALDPAAREIREEGTRGAMALDARASSMDAFGGSRAALMRSENREKTLQGISDLYGEGYAKAYESGLQVFGEERARDLMAAGRIQDVGTNIQRANTTDISTLMATGATDRNIQQAMMDFDYQQFIEERDWDIRNLAGLLAAIGGTQGSYGTTTTTETEQKANPMSQVLGFATTILGAYLSGGASLAGAAAGGTGQAVDQYGYGGDMMGPPQQG